MAESLMKRGFLKISEKGWNKNYSIVSENSSEAIREGESLIDFSVMKSFYEDIILPKRATSGSAGYDIFSPFPFIVSPREYLLVPTGIKAYMLNDEYLMIVPRSSFGFKYRMMLANTIAIGDSDYFNAEKNEGHYFLKIFNGGDREICVKKGEAFAQAIFQKYLLVDGDDFMGASRIGGIGSTNE